MSFVTAAVVSILLTPLAISVARRTRLVDRAGGLKVHVGTYRQPARSSATAGRTSSESCSGAGTIETASGGWPELLTAGACLGAFAYELLSTVLRRLGHRAPTLAGDRDHSYDRLASRLRSRAASTYVMWIAGGVSVMIGLVVHHVRPLVGALVIAAATTVAAAIHTRLRPSIPEVQR